MTLSASSLEIATNSSFSNQTSEFNPGQTIYVRVTSDSSGDKKSQLNLRDNDYKILTTYSLSKNGNIFSTSLSAPTAENYYSLEAIIESEDSNSTSVKTVKIGNPNDANVKVSVKSQVNTHGVTTNDNPTPSSKAAQSSQKVEKTEKGTEEMLQAQDYSFEKEENPKNQNLLISLVHTIGTIVDIIWPF